MASSVLGNTWSYLGCSLKGVEGGAGASMCYNAVESAFQRKVASFQLEFT